MGRLLSLFVIGCLLYLIFRGFFRAKPRRAEPEEMARRGEDMVSCARCGVNMPRSEARQEAGRWICQANPGCH